MPDTPQITAEDRWQIHDLLARYCVALDTEDFALLETVFSDDADIDYGADGYQGIGPGPFIEFVRGASDSFAGSFHNLGTSLVESTADGVRGRTYGTGVMSGKPPLEGEVYAIMGWYLDRFEKREEGWRIVARSFELSATAGNPAVLPDD